MSSSPHITNQTLTFSSVQVINDPHVITIARELPHAQGLLSALYQCDYKAFFHAVSTSDKYEQAVDACYF